MTHLRHAHTNMPGFVSHPARYDRLTRPFFARLHARIAADVAAAELPHGSRLLEAGTGPGRVPITIAAEQPQLRIDGIDLSPDMIGHAQRQATQAGTAGQVTFTVGDVADLPYPDSTFDLIVSSMSQHHWADPQSGMRELHRVLRPGGRIWIYDMRFALRRARRAAIAAVPTAEITVETVRTGRLPIRLAGRVSLA